MVQILFRIVLQKRRKQRPPGLRSAFVPKRNNSLTNNRRLPTGPLRVLTMAFELPATSTLNLRESNNLTRPIFQGVL